MENKWWQKEVVYQIYPKSFKDSNNDGIGDLQGIIDQLDYLENLGVTCLWICPVYKSPMVDNGYDISDYEDINPMFGTSQLMDELIEKAKKRGISIIMDLVINHCSSEHAWFKDAISNPKSPYKDFFIFKEGKNGQAPNNWRSVFGGSVWEEVPGQDNLYYFHSFAKEQPDLNWENPNMRKEIYAMINRWLEKGIKGFRVDAINFMKKAPLDTMGEVDGKDNLSSCFPFVRNVEGIDDIYRDIKKHTFDLHDCMTVSETVGVDYDICEGIIGKTGCFTMMFDFNYCNIDVDNEDYFRRRNFEISELQSKIDLSQSQIQKIGWSAPFLENHDQPRSINKYIKDKDYQNDIGAKALATLYFLLRGTPFIYQGQEIGMTNSFRNSIKEYDDLQAYSQYERSIQEGFTKEEALEFVNLRSRDHARAVMSWDDSDYAGFSLHSPWLFNANNYKEVNVSKQYDDPNSTYNYYRSLIQLRNKSEYSNTLIEGFYEIYHVNNDEVVSYKRVKDKQVVVLVNMSGQSQTIDEVKGKVLLSNYTVDKEVISKLLPYQAVVLAL